jgi:ergothioneine biosynthesis protein EgtB
MTRQARAPAIAVDETYASSPSPSSLAERLFATRRVSMKLAEPLSAEDMTVQAMEDASPTKWHLAHVTWFFETFLLAKHLPGYRIFDETFNYCFNSYYEAQGARHPRPKRGLLTRPSAASVMAYRAHVDGALAALMRTDLPPEAAWLIEVGINHEQQHQELLLTDILALFAANPLRPAYRAKSGARSKDQPSECGWIDYPGGIVSVGSDGSGYAWDNEFPRHQVLVQPYRLADRLVTNAEWLAFINDDGYATASLWLADGWTRINQELWKAPLYWEEIEGEWHQMSLEGLKPIQPAAPVCNVSYYEADAFARWADKRLPTEFEWEAAARTVVPTGNTLGSGALRPRPCETANGMPRQMFGDVWEWTGSAYMPYPGYKPPAGAIGEYNGKFMVSQHVLRGASCATPDGHSRPTYRNFFYPHQRWQFTGLRLASEIE